MLYRKKGRVGIVTIFASLFWILFVISGCGTMGGKAPEKRAATVKEKGDRFEIGQIKAGSFETPPDIPATIRFDLAEMLKAKGLLVSPASSEKRLVVNVKTTAYYVGAVMTRTCFGCYSELTSEVEVVDPHTPQIVAKTLVRSYNGWGRQTSDFTEWDHVKEIVGFLESIVR